MSDRTWPLRVALFAVPAWIAAAREPWLVAALLGAFAGATGFVLDWRVRAFFDREVSFFATLALMASLTLVGNGGPVSWSLLLTFSGACLAFAWLTADPAPGPVKLAIASAIGLLPAAWDVIHAAWWRVSPENLLVGLWGPSGLLYGAPLLWAGFVGLAGMAREKPGLARLSLAAITSGLLGFLLATESGFASTRALTWLPFLLPGLAHGFQAVQRLAIRRPERLIGGASVGLVLWNLLFMEQYRLVWIPSDQTTSFAQVTSNSAGLLSRKLGTPFAWPANWLFAWRFHAPVDRWESVAGRSLFETPSARTAIVEVGDDASAFALDTALLLEGFGMRRTCERGWCRDLRGEGRMLFPQKGPGHGDLAIRARARGEGTLRLSFDGAATVTARLSESLEDVVLRVPARLVEPGLHVLTFATAPQEKATLDRVTFERDP